MRVYRYNYQGQFAEDDLETGWNHFGLREYNEYEKLGIFYRRGTPFTCKIFLFDNIGRKKIYYFISILKMMKLCVKSRSPIKAKYSCL